MTPTSAPATAPAMPSDAAAPAAASAVATVAETVLPPTMLNVLPEDAPEWLEKVRVLSRSASWLMHRSHTFPLP
jgi:hypothetical protein